MIVSDTDILNSIIEAFRSRNWLFVGVMKFNAFMFQCWVQIDSKIYCCTYSGEWDAVRVSDHGHTAGEWNAEITGLLRAA